VWARILWRFEGSLDYTQGQVIHYSLKAGEWKWRRNDPPKRREIRVQRNGVTSEKTRFSSNTAARAPDLAYLFIVQ